MLAAGVPGMPAKDVMSTNIALDFVIELTCADMQRNIWANKEAYSICAVRLQEP